MQSVFCLCYSNYNLLYIKTIEGCAISFRLLNVCVCVCVQVAFLRCSSRLLLERFRFPSQRCSFTQYGKINISQVKLSIFSHYPACH